LHHAPAPIAGPRDEVDPARCVGSFL
jgi:hypothetical protein